MTLLSPWALLALAALVPLWLAHSRRPPSLEVPSILLWRELGVTASPRARRIARPALSLLLALQAAAIILAVAALAEPAPASAARAPAAPPVTAVPAAGEPSPASSAGSALAVGPLPSAAGVTIVGAGPALRELARAFAAAPGVPVRALSPARFLAHPPTGRQRGLLVLDHWLPPGGIPRSAPAVLLVDPPGGGGAGRPAGPRGSTVISGLDDSSPLLDGVDLTSLSVPATAMTRVAGPAWLSPVAWAPGGPLLAAGTGPGMRRLAVLAVDPARTSLPDLAAFPILARNILRWAVEPAAAPGAAPAAARAPARDAGAWWHWAWWHWAWWHWAVAAALLALAGEAACLGMSRGPARRRGHAGSWRSPAGPRGAFPARLAAVALLGAALAVPGITRPGGGAPLVLADRSGSVTGHSRSAEDSWLEAIRRQAPQARVVTFGEPGGTDLAAALRFGAAAIGRAPGNTSRLVVLSDGLATRPGTLAAARAAGVPVDVAPVAGTGPDVAVTRLAAPASVRAGDTIALQVTVHASVASQATLTAWRDGRALTRLATRLAAGDNPLLMSSPSGQPGWRSFRVTVTSQADSVPADDALDAVTRVAPRPRVLYAGAGARVPALLRRLGLGVTALPPARLPRQPGGYRGADAVILDDVPAGAMDPAQAAALVTAVRAGGLGLLALGGPHSLDAAWYAGTALPAALPVTGTGSGPDGVSMELALDRSGSMNDLAGSVPKIDMARASALEAIAFAQAHHDKLGIVSFDVTPRVLVPLREMTAAAAAAAQRAVRGLSADGGTNIYAALRTGAGQLARAPGARGSGNLILMTDGVSQSASYDALARGLRASGVTLSAVGLGGQVDQALLRRLAALGGGRYYYTDDAAALPRIFAAEERRTVRPDYVTGHVPVHVTASAPAARSLTGKRLPDVGGLDATAVKSRATAVISTGEVTTSAGGGAAGAAGGTSGGTPGGPGASRYPVLAQWRYGLGRVAAWTPGLSDAAWAGGWPGQASLWSDTVRWLLPGVPVPALTPALPDAHPAGAPAVIVGPLAGAGPEVTATALHARVIPPRGPAAQVTLPAGPGGSGYAGSLPDAGPGVYRVSVSGPGAGPSGVVTELAVGYPREYLPSPTGTALLAQVAAITGGRVLGAPAGGAAWERARNGTRRLAVWWPLVLLALAMFTAAVSLARPPRRRPLAPRTAAPDREFTASP